MKESKRKKDRNTFPVCVGVCVYCGMCISESKRQIENEGKKESDISNEYVCVSGCVGVYFNVFLCVKVSGCLFCFLCFRVCLSVLAPFSAFPVRVCMFLCLSVQKDL